MMKHFFIVIALIISTLAQAQKPTQKVLDDNNAKLREALALQHDGKLAESNQKLTDLYALRYMTDFVCWNLANNYYNLKDYKRAERFASQAMEEGSQYVLQAGILKAMSLGMRGRHAEELQLLQELAQHFPDDPAPHFALAVHLWNHNDRHNADKEFHSAIKLDKANASMHLRIAYLNNDAQLYVHAFLAYYMYLFINPSSYGKEAILTLNEIMNRRNVNNIIDEKTANDALLTKEDSDLIWAMLFINELKTCAIDSESGLPDVDNFVDNSRRLLTSVCESIEEKEGFYEEFYIDFYQKLLKADMLDAFLYYCLSKTYPDLNDEIPMSKEKMTSFADWLEGEWE